MARDIEDELDQLREMYASGALSEAEYRRAKAVILGKAEPGSQDDDSPSPGDDASESSPSRPLSERKRKRKKKRAVESDESDRSELESELLVLDREWEVQREQYLVHSRYGEPTEPNWFGMSIRLIVGLLVAGIGLGFVLRGSANNMIGIGAPLLCIGGVIPLFYGRNFLAFQTAYAEYQKRRRRILGKMSEPED
jgi:hypothetical protein